MEQQIFKFRGIDMPCLAEVLTDTAEGITYGEVFDFAPAVEIGRTASSESAVSFGNNKPLIIVRTEGNDEISISCFGISLELLAKITGKTFDKDRGMFIDNQGNVVYFAFGYREKLTNGKYRYNWRLKGTFSVPAEISATEDDGTESVGQDIVYTGIYTTHEFTNGGSAKGVVVDTQYTGAKVTDFFKAPVTPDTVAA